MVNNQRLVGQVSNDLNEDNNDKTRVRVYKLTISLPEQKLWHYSVNIKNQVTPRRYLIILDPTINRYLKL